MSKYVVWISLALAIVLIGFGTSAQDSRAVEIHDAWARPSIEGSPVGAAYFTVINRSDTLDTLISVSTPAAAMAELHSMDMQGDIMRMRHIDGLEVPAGGTAALEPGGLHVMLMALAGDLLEGDRIPLTLTFESGLVLTTDARVTAEPFPHTLAPDALTAAQLAAVAAGTYVGQVVSPPVQVQEFLLPSNLNANGSLSDSNGTWRVIFFGYMHCPDLCPLTLVDYRDAKRILAEDAAQVSFVFISVDATRDTPDKLARYLNNFDSSFVGFTGDDVTLNRIQPDYGFFYERRMESGSLAVYSIDHSTRSYLVDPDGLLRASFAYNTDPIIIAETLRWYLGFDGAN